jgi:hypothetical protein
VVVVQGQRDVEDLQAVEHLAHDLALGGRLHRVGERRGREADAGRRLAVDADVQLRDQHLLLNLQVGDAGDAFHRGLGLLRERAERVEVVAEDLDGDLRADAREQCSMRWLMGWPMPVARRGRPRASLRSSRRPLRAGGCP